MALSTGSVSLPVRPDAQGFGSSLRGQIAGDGIMLGIGATIGNQIVRGIEGTIRGATRALTSIISTGLSETLDASAGIAQMNAGIVSTNNVANVTVKGMTDLASSIQAMSGQTDDSIVAAQNLLLTFTNIRNVGADTIFDDATKAAANMAAKFGGDASSQAILLGKALNDPVKGITALQRVGVSFTESQRDQIAAMVDAGDTIGAQKIILSELTTEFGGAAEAAGESLPGGLAKLRRSFEDLSQQLVEGPLGGVLGTIFGSITTTLKAIQDSPAFGLLVDKLTAFGDGAATKIQGVFDSILTVFQSGTKTPVSDLIGLLVDSSPQLQFLADLFDKLEPSLPAIADSFVKIGEALAPVIPQLADIVAELLPPLLVLVVALIPLIGPLADLLVAIAPAVVAIVQAITPLIGLNTDLMLFFATLVQGVFDGKTSITDLLGMIANAPESIRDDFARISGLIFGMVNGAIDALNGLASILPGFLNMISDALGIGVHVSAMQLPHIGGTLSLTAADPNADIMSGAKLGKKAAMGGTFEPIPGGHVVNLAEAGRAETVVDTATLRAFAASTANRGPLIHQTINPAPGMSEETIGRVAADQLNFALRGR